MIDFLKAFAANEVKSDSGATGSKSGEINLSDVKSLLQHSLIVGLAAAVAAIASGVGAIDWGVYGPILVPLISTGLIGVQKYLTDNSKE